MPGWTITKKDLMLLCRDGRTLVILLLLPITFMYIIGKSVATGEDNTKTPIAVWDNVTDQFDLNDYRKMRPGRFEYDVEEVDQGLDPISEEDLQELAELDNLTSAEEMRQILEEELQTLQKNCRMITDRIIEKMEHDPGLMVTRVKSKEELAKFQTNHNDQVAIEFSPTFWFKVERLTLDDIMDSESGLWAKGLGEIDIITHKPRIKNSSRESASELFIKSSVLSSISPYVGCKSGKFEKASKSTCEPYQPGGKLPPIEEKVAAEDAPEEIEQIDTETAQLNELFVFVVPGFTVMFMFFLVNIMARSFLQEKQQGTLQRLQIAPMRPSSVLVGKTVPFFLISLVQTLLLFLFGKVAFDMNMGNDLLMLGVIVVLTSLSVVGLGLIVAVLVKTDAQVSSYANFIVIMMAGVSGCFIPSDWISDPILTTLRLGTPHHWALQGMRELISADVPNMHVVWQSCKVLITFSVCFFVFGTMFWRNRTAG